MQLELVTKCYKVSCCSRFLKYFTLVKLCRTVRNKKLMLCAYVKVLCCITGYNSSDTHFQPTCNTDQLSDMHVLAMQRTDKNN